MTAPWASAPKARGTCADPAREPARRAFVGFFAPAKVNLCSASCGARTAFTRSKASSARSRSSTRSAPGAPRGGGPGVHLRRRDAARPGDDNLVVRAAKLFCASCGLEPLLRIQLTKHIPHGAGLGGGSSDAATVLIGLNRLFETELSREALSAMAADLGSDVPFFIYQSAAIIRGRGEVVEPAAFPHELPLFLIKPPFGVPTPWAYKHWRESREVPGVRYEAHHSRGAHWSTTSNGPSSKSTFSSPT